MTALPWEHAVLAQGLSSHEPTTFLRGGVMSDERITRYEGESEGELPAVRTDRRELSRHYEDDFEYELPRQSVAKKLAFAVVALAVALVSFFILGARFSTPEAYTNTIAALDAKKDTVMRLVGASTGSSAAITLLPGDVATPIAEKLIDLSSDFLFVLAAIYLEKYLLTILGFVSFRILIPIGCALLMLSLVLDRNQMLRSISLQLGAKILVFGVAVVCVVPASVFISNMIERTYETSINETIAAAEQNAEDITEASQEGEVAQTEVSTQSPGLLETLQQLPGTIQQLPETIQQLPQTIQGLSGKVTELTQEAQDSLNRFIEALAVMIVTSCVIPLLVLLFIIWLARTILGVDMPIPTEGLRRRGIGGRHRRI